MGRATVLDRLHERIVQHPFLRAFTWITRVLLFLGFAPSGIKKILNEPFTLR